MKKITLFFTLIFVGFLGQAQTTLAPGDIAIVLINATDNTVNTSTANDNISFVLLRDIASGTKIYFTDFGWRSDAPAFQTANPCGGSTGAVSDGIVEWTATSALTYGTVVHMNVKFTPTVNIGTITGYQATFNVASQFVSIAISSEAVFAYQGSISSPTLITGVNTKNAWATTLANCDFNPTASTLPSSLTTGLSALCWSTTSVNGILNSSVVLTGNRATDLANIYNPENWTYNGSVAFAIPSYTVTATPVITSNPADRTICNGGTTTFSVSASDATSYQWQVNTGSGFVNVSDGVTYSGTTTTTLTISSATTGMNGYLYRCVATGSTSVNSNSGSLTVSSSSAPTASAQTFCSGATVTNLVATGTSLKWYTGNSGGSALATSTPLNSGTYYVSQTINSCESTRTPVSVTINTTPLAPTASAQSFCIGATVANLVASPGVARLAPPALYKWYTASTGGSPLSTSTALVTGTYYVSYTQFSCESSRTSVAVTVNTTPAPTASAQTFCSGATVADLVATGTSLQWYTANSGGNALATSTTLNSGTYYVSQTLNSCESIRTSVSVTVNTTSAPTASAQTFCSGATVADLVATGTSLQWYTASSGGSALATSTPLNSGTYYVSQTLNSCESIRTSVSVTVNTTSAPTASAQTFCSGATVADLVASSGVARMTPSASYKWYTTSTGGSDLATSTALSSGTYYVSQTLNDCESDRTSVSVTVTPSTSNTTTQTACTSYTWSVNGTTYTTSGTYTSVTGCATEILDLTIITPPTNFTSGNINYVVTSPTTVEVGLNPDASGEIDIPATVTTDCGTYSVTSICNYAFENCSGLAHITIPNSITNIGEYAFKSCSGLSTITIPNSVTSIGYAAFAYCTNLTSFTIPNSVTSINTYTFAYCINLSSVNIPNSVTNIGDYAFIFCGLTSITIPNSVTSIGEGVFGACSLLTSVTIPDSITNIGNYAFYLCSSLTSVTIPSTVTSIGEFAFGDCISLSSVICNVTSPITIAESVFANVNQAACTLTVPAGSVVAYQSAAVWQDFYFSNNNFSKVMDSQCGTTLPAINTLIRANAITGASHYKFKVVNGTTTQIIEPTSGRWFRLTSLPGGTFYNTTYTISVAVKKDNVWGEYGASCAVTTPAFPTTEIQNAQCGSTLSALNSLISANAVSRATGYRFKVVNGTSTEIIESSFRRWFRLTSLPGGALYNTTYTISVATKYNGVWSEYGTECTVTTPDFLLTKVQDSQCGVTLASIATLISADAVNGASGYRFKVVNQTTEETIEAASGSRWFRLTSLSGGASYNTTYTISAASKYNGVWSNYGNECAITTPSAPSTKLTDRQCGMTLASDNTTILYANAISVAQNYRFEVSLGADVYTYDTASSSVRSFRMTEVPGLTLVSGTTYSIRVAIMVNDAWQPYGESCNITTFGVAPNFVKTMNVDITNFNVITYPNPFTENFNLNLTSLSEEKVTVMVYDMTGKLLERKEVVPSELSELQVGTNFASGVYNVIVSQGENIKSLRVIKK